MWETDLWKNYGRLSDEGGTFAILKYCFHGQKEKTT